MESKLKAAIYARVSTDDKDQNPETQLRILREFCARAGWEVTGEYVDQARAKDYPRRIRWQQLNKDARQHLFKVVVVYKLDRAFRHVKECLNCLEDWTERGIAFKCVTQDAVDTTTSMGRFVLQILAAAAELESSLIWQASKSKLQALNFYYTQHLLGYSLFLLNTGAANYLNRFI